MSMQPAELSVVIPTFNERGNLGELIKRITSALEGIRWEVIVAQGFSR
jgi:dolichol-phosphate mannosyltransferase